MKTIDLKSILTLTFCILGTLFLNTHAFGQAISSSELGVDLNQHLTGQKTIYFTNWTAAYHNDPNGAIKVKAECVDVKRTSTQLNGFDLALQANQTSYLPASGYNWSDYWNGTQICQGDMIRLKAVLTIGGQDFSSPNAFKLYKNFEPVKTDDGGHPLINYSCFGSRDQYPFIRYMPAEFNGVPEGHTDPNGYYELFDSCRN